MRLTRLLTEKEIELVNDYSLKEEKKLKLGDFTSKNNVSPQELENKLGQLEDIEEELGIELIAFFKYLSAKEVFFINDFNEVQRAVVRSIDKKGLIVFEEAFSWGECDFTLYFKDYGKTWALTKEELEHE